MVYDYKKRLFISTLKVIFILGIALIATINIYYKFESERNVNYTSESLEITYHEKEAPKVTLKKVTPVTDAVGLSSKAYSFTIKNNMTTNKSYNISLVEDFETIEEDDCIDNLIPRKLIRVSLKEGKGKEKIYSLKDLEKGLLKKDVLEPLKEAEYTIRVWTTNEIPTTSIDNLHYHGKIVIEEEM